MRKVKCRPIKGLPKLDCGNNFPIAESITIGQIVTCKCGATFILQESDIVSNDQTTVQQPHTALPAEQLAKA